MARNILILNIFKKLLDNLLIEQADGESYFYLIRNEENEIVGRINLIDIDSETRISSLGYRVGEKFTKKRSCNCDRKINFRRSKK